jgi:CBS domain containing-hemolysin-like protein
MREILDLMLRHGYSRIPLYKENVDDIVGVAYAKDLLRHLHAGKGDVALEKVMREAYFVPETKKVAELLKEMQLRRIHIAIVLDEYGSTVGLVTIEDLLEELVGEIADEYDVDFAETATEELTAPDRDRTFLVDGLLREDELAEQTGFTLPEGPYETLAGFLLARLGRIPVVGESFEEDGWEFTVMEVDRHRIQQVRVVAPPEPADE